MVDKYSSDSSFRNVMRNLTSSVVVITSCNGPLKNGLTATAMCSLSADPESILACVNKDATAIELILRSGHFAVNVLAEDQQDVARCFSTPKLAAEERFRCASWHELNSGAPILTGAIANLDCEVASHLLYGTHYVLIGRILAMASREGRGLLYGGGQYQRLLASA